MSKAILCDKCDKPAVILEDDEEYMRVDADFKIELSGETVARYGDLCDECVEEITVALIDILGDAFIHEEVEEIPTDLEDLGEVTDFPKDFVEEVDGFDEDDYKEAMKIKVDESLSALRQTDEYKKAAEALGDVGADDMMNVFSL